MADDPTRPSTTSLTPERRETIGKAIAAGIPITTACEIAGIHKTTFHRAMKGSRPVERDFQKAVEQARAEAELNLVASLTRAARNGSWRAAAWLLERRNPEQWGTIRDRRFAAEEADAAEKVNPLKEFDKVADELAAKRKKKGGR